MCGRFTLKTPPDQWGQLLLPLADCMARVRSFQPRYNIAPTQNIWAIVYSAEAAALELDSLRWGLVPGWADDLAIGNRMINARRETLAEKRSYRGPLEKRRCLILADGYYEWEKLSQGGKQPYWITARAGGVFQLAGLWELNQRATGQPTSSCTLITTAANAALTRIHDRMPVVMCDAAAQRWMEPDCGSQEAQELLGPADDDFFTAQAVSTHVNNPRHEGPACVQPA